MCEFINLLLNNSLNSDIEVDTYSGRYMYGKKCISIRGSEEECREFIKTCAISVMESLECYSSDDECSDDPDFYGMVDTLLSYKTDQLGLGVVYYWPDVEFSGVSANEN